MMVLLIVLPLIFAFLAAIKKSFSYPLLVTSTVVNVIIVLLLKTSVPSVHVLGGWKPPFGINLVLDDASYYAVLIANIVFFLVALFKETVGKYSTVLMVMLAAVNGFVLTGDLFNSFVFLEILTATGVILASKRENYYNAFKYLVLGSLAGSMYLLATIFTYTQVGSLNMAHASYFAISEKAIVVITILYLVGLGVEAKLFPLNGWVSGVYGGNDLSPLVMATAVSFAALYMMGRLFLTVFGGYALHILYVLALITIVAGELAALYQKNLLKTLAYSSIAQAGIVLAAISKSTEKMVSLAYFHLTNDVIAKFVLFLVATFLVYNYKNLNGVFKKHKVLGTAFTISSMSLIGFPLFAGFQSKLRMLMEMFKTSDYLFPAVLLFATVIELTYLVRWNVKLWFEDIEDESEVKGPALRATISIILAILLVGIFLAPNIILNPTTKVAKALLDSTSYINNVIASSMGGM